MSAINSNIFIFPVIEDKQIIDSVIEDAKITFVDITTIDFPNEESVKMYSLHIENILKRYAQATTEIEKLRKEKIKLVSKNQKAKQDAVEIKEKVSVMNDELISCEKEVASSLEELDDVKTEISHIELEISSMNISIPFKGHLENPDIAVLFSKVLQEFEATKQKYSELQTTLTYLKELQVSRENKLLKTKYVLGLMRTSFVQLNTQLEFAEKLERSANHHENEIRRLEQQFLGWQDMHSKCFQERDELEEFLQEDMRPLFLTALSYDAKNNNDFVTDEHHVCADALFKKTISVKDTVKRIKHFYHREHHTWFIKSNIQEKNTWCLTTSKIEYLLFLKLEGKITTLPL